MEQKSDSDDEVIPAGSFKVPIKLPNKPVFHVIANGSTTVGELNDLIYQKKGIDPSSYRLVFRGKEMSEKWRPLCDFNIDTADIKTIDVVPTNK